MYHRVCTKVEINQLKAKLMKCRKLVFGSDFANHYTEVAISIVFYLCLFLLYRILINNSALVYQWNSERSFTKKTQMRIQHENVFDSVSVE